VLEGGPNIIGEVTIGEGGFAECDPQRFVELVSVLVDGDVIILAEIARLLERQHLNLIELFLL
jgi:hypothetical protein